MCQEVHELCHGKVRFQNPQAGSKLCRYYCVAILSTEKGHIFYHHSAIVASNNNNYSVLRLQDPRLS